MCWCVNVLMCLQLRNKKWKVHRFEKKKVKNPCARPIRLLHFGLYILFSHIDGVFTFFSLISMEFLHFFLSLFIDRMEFPPVFPQFRLEFSFFFSPKMEFSLFFRLVCWCVDVLMCCIHFIENFFPQNWFYVLLNSEFMC